MSETVKVRLTALRMLNARDDVPCFVDDLQLFLTAKTGVVVEIPATDQQFLKGFEEVTEDEETTSPDSVGSSDDETTDEDEDEDETSDE